MSINVDMEGTSETLYCQNLFTGVLKQKSFENQTFQNFQRCQISLKFYQMVQ